MTDRFPDTMKFHISHSDPDHLKVEDPTYYHERVVEKLQRALSISRSYMERRQAWNDSDANSGPYDEDLYEALKEIEEILK